MAAASPASFSTAREGDTAILTRPSTVQTSRNSPAPAITAPPARYREAAQLPFELAHHCSVYLESGQYLQGFSLLTSLLRAGSSSSPSNRLPAQIPPTQLFELAATLAVYPAVTTRASTPDKIHCSNAAVRYLRDVNRVIGPVNAGFANALVFSSAFSRSRTGRKRGAFGSPTGGSNYRVEDERPIKSAVANKNSLWAKADDFWHVLGWAFNCSVKHKARWERWKIWLELMLEIMEDDWKERTRLRDEQLSREGMSEDLLQQSIIAQHLIGANASSLSGRRMMLRAILADGGAKATGEFREVFKDELMGKKEQVAKPIKEMRLDQGDFGDLDLDPDDEEDDVDLGKIAGLPIRRGGRNSSGRATNTRRVSIVSLGSDSEDSVVDESISPTDRLGGMDSVRLRQRILAFLAVIAESLPAHITSREQLFDSYTEHLRPLPAPIFAILIRSSMLPAPAQCILAANTLLPLLPNSPPVYNLIPPSQDDWMKHFFPYAANTHSFADNAKVSILFQQVLQLTPPGLKWSKSWVEAVLKGIRARRKKARGLNKSSGGLRSDEIVAEKIFKESEQLLLLLVEWVEHDAKVPLNQRPHRNALIAEMSPTRKREGSTSDLTSVPPDSDDELRDVDMEG